LFLAVSNRLKGDRQNNGIHPDGIGVTRRKEW
jgi:hypothetical protein